MRLDEACECSLGQLRLLAEAHGRLVARQGLVDLQGTMAAVAACWSKDGGRFCEKVRAELMKKI
jgi:hypothetical protein